MFITAGPRTKLSQMGSKLENLFFNKHPFARDGLRAGCRGGLKGRLPSRGLGAAAVDRTQSATRVSPGAQLAHHRERCSGWLPQAGEASGRLTGRRKPTRKKTFPTPLGRPRTTL